MKIALPKGRLLLGVLDLFEKAGLTLENVDPRNYHSRILGTEFALEAVMVKPRSIPQLLALGYVDAGFTGYDVYKNEEEKKAACNK